MSIVKVNYRTIIDAYHSDLDMLNSYTYIALEADELGNPENHTNILSGLIQKFKILINKIIAIINRGISHIKFVANKITLDSKHYVARLRSREITVKPMKVYKYIGYEYNTDAMLTIYGKTMNIVLKHITTLSEFKPSNSQEDSPLNGSIDDLFKTIYSTAVGKELNKPEELYQEIKQVFRGDKKEIIVREDQAAEISRRSEGRDKDRFLRIITNDLSKLKTMVNTLKASERFLHNLDMTEADKSKYLTSISKASRLYAFANTLCTYCYELYVEEVVANRVIARNIYHF